MEPLYNIYFAGQILEGQDLSAVRARMAKLFNASEAVLARLFSGEPQVIKRDCDKATALKYKKAMESAGARPMITAAANDKAQARQGAAPQAGGGKPNTAERIAAIAAAPDVAYPNSDSEAEQDEPEDKGLPPKFTLGPVGCYLVNPDERPTVETPAIDVSDISVEADYGRLAAEQPTPPPAPDTDHYSMGEAGEDIPSLVQDTPAPPPDTSGVDLCPQGTDFSDCVTPDSEAPDLNLADYCLAPEGSDMLEAQFRPRPAAAAPDTSHLSTCD